MTAMALRQPNRVSDASWTPAGAASGLGTLLHEFRARAQAAGRTVVQIDGRDVDPSPEGLETAEVASLLEADCRPQLGTSGRRAAIGAVTIRSKRLAAR